MNYLIVEVNGVVKTRNEYKSLDDCQIQLCKYYHIFYQKDSLLKDYVLTFTSRWGNYKIYIEEEKRIKSYELTVDINGIREDKYTVIYNNLEDAREFIKLLYNLHIESAVPINNGLLYKENDKTYEIKVKEI